MIPFADFLSVAHGRELAPYSWQERLAERCAKGEPPPAVAVPTGAGKTVAIDALIWALANQVDRPAARRTVGVRVVWAIDRRILVDEVYEHAARLAALLQVAQSDNGHPLHEMADRLAELSGDVPLVATRWRGGLEARPERCGPLQPQVITSTIAQIGSRLLFRGYGVGKRSLAIEAGLAACDTTICLDEAHLAQPFRETIEAIRAHRAASERGLALPGLHTITLTATPPRDEPDAIVLDEQDRLALGRRFTGEKRARLLELETGDGEPAQVKLLAGCTADYVRDGSRTVACVLNTVRRARAVFDVLVKEIGEEADLALLIGPQRPADRERVLEQHRRTLFDGVAGEKPLICVATQTFEVGLDADVEAMVTESASTTALVQRLGRLNRRGETSGQATIVRDEGRSLYAEDEPAAWAWLQGLVAADGLIDVSVAALASNPPPPSSRPRYAATLTREVVEMFVQTTPQPGGWREPDPGVFLRGPEEKAVAEVALCWRSDLRPDLIGREFDEYRSTLVKLVPPQRQELLTLSLAAARALLAARYSQESPARAARMAQFEADVEDATNEDPDSLPDVSNADSVPFIVLRGEHVHRGTLERPARDEDGSDEETRDIAPRTLRPGDIVVIPTSAGGVDDHGLAPRQPRGEPATDVAADLRVTSRPAPVRVTPEALAARHERQIALSRWQRVAAACTRAEEEIQVMRGQARREHRVDQLVERLLSAALLADHPGLGVLAPGSPGRVGWSVTLRSITPADADTGPRLDETDLGTLDEDESPAEEPDMVIDDGAEAQPDQHQDDAKTTDGDTTKLRELNRVWVLLPVREKDVSGVERYLNDPSDGPPTIDQHARAVAEEVNGVTRRLHLAPALSGALSLAAFAHDHGKADERTQAFYRRGVFAIASEPIAKSEFGTRDPRAAEIARRLAGLPKRQRHEVASVAVLDDALASGRVEMEMDGLDRDLALHAVGTHHGLGRPIPQVPEVPDGGRPPRIFEVDAAGIAGSAAGDGRDGWADGEWLERFWRICDRYGPWGMAYLEALLVLSDRSVSSEGK